MKFLPRLLKTKKEIIKKPSTKDKNMAKQVSALYSLLTEVYGSDKVVLKAGKLGALKLMNSSVLEEKVLCLQRLIYENPTLDKVPSTKDIPDIIGEIEEHIADVIAKKNVEERIESKINEQINKRQEEYMKEIKLKVLKENEGADNAETLKKFAELEKLERRNLTKSAMEIMRPDSLGNVVGQQQAIRSLLAKVATPYPQHVILYGPPGVGKTTVARLVLEEAKTLPSTPFDKEALFVEVDGTTLRWDPREITNPLLGSVHDPIYQGARKDFAETGVPEPKTGLVTEAHGGILFIDEIGELNDVLLNKLLKVLEDKRVSFDSPYYDPADPNIPKYVRKLFEEGAPADFILVGATTRNPESISPALRSRCAEIFFEPLTIGSIKEIIANSAKQLNVSMDHAVPDLISEYTIEGRKAIGILSDSYGLAVYDSFKNNSEGDIQIKLDHVYEVLRASRIYPYSIIRGSDTKEVGKIYGLGVSNFVGSAIEIEAVAFKASKKGIGTTRFNEAAGKMAKDSVFNASSVVRRLTGICMSDYDIHVNIVGGGLIDGPSAGAAILVAILSAIKNRPLSQNFGVTGEISIQGKLKGIGGVFEKIYGARQAGIKTVIVPEENRANVPDKLTGIDVLYASSAKDLLKHIFGEEFLDVEDVGNIV